MLLLTTPTANTACKVWKATTHAPAHRGAQLYSQFSSNNHRGDSRGVASVVSLATTRARTRSMQQQKQQQQQQHTNEAGPGQPNIDPSNDGSISPCFSQPSIGAPASTDASLRAGAQFHTVAPPLPSLGGHESLGNEPQSEDLLASQAEGSPSNPKVGVLVLIGRALLFFMCVCV